MVEKPDCYSIFGGLFKKVKGNALPEALTSSEVAIFSFADQVPTLHSGFVSALGQGGKPLDWPNFSASGPDEFNFNCSNASVNGAFDTSRTSKKNRAHSE